VMKIFKVSFYYSTYTGKETPFRSEINKMTSSKLTCSFYLRKEIKMLVIFRMLFAYMSPESNYNTRMQVKVKNPIPPTRRPPHHRHTTDALVSTLSMHRPTHYRRVGWHSTDALVEIFSLSNYYFVISFSWKQEQLHKKGRKHYS